MTRLTKRNLMFAVPALILLVLLRIEMQSEDVSVASDARFAVEVSRAVSPHAESPRPAAKPGLMQPSATAGQVRSRIWDASDVMVAVRRAQSSGTPDEKWFAQEILRECFLFTTPPPGRLADGKDGPSRQGQRDAWAALEKRCEGVKALRWDERRALINELKEGAAASAATMQALIALTERQRMGDRRWNQGDLDTITQALHGGDSIERREAFGLLFSSIDKTAPGGRARYEGMLFSLADEIQNDPISEFELLERCAIFPNCAADASGTAPLDNEEVALADPDYERLKSLYTEAFAKRLSASAILAIR